MRFRFAVTALLLIAPVAAHAKPAAPAQTEAAAAKTELAAAIVATMHFADTAATYRTSLTAQTFPTCGDGKKDAAISGAWAAAVNKVMVERAFAAGVREELANSLGLGELKEIAAFMASPLGRKLESAEVAALRRGVGEQASPEQQMARLAGITRHLAANPRRKQALQRLVRASGGEAARLEQLVNMQIGISLGIVATMKSGPVMGHDEVLAEVDKMRPTYRALVAATTLPGIEYVYETIGTGEIDAYSAFLEQATGRKLVRIFNDFTSRRTRDIMIAVGAEFARNMQSVDL